MNNKLYFSLALLCALLTGAVLSYLILPQVMRSPAGDARSERAISYWVAPMDPSFRRDTPGQSPMGMDLVPVYADDVDATPGVVKIDPTIVNNLGVRTAVAEHGSLSRRINTVGYIGYDEDTVQHVHTRVDGWIENLATKSVGATVEKGQLLFELYAPTLVNAQQEYLAALRSGNAALQKASSDRLLALGVDEGGVAQLRKSRKLRQRVRVYADSDGVVAHLGARDGVFVTPATEIMSIVKLDRVWVLAEVFERQSAWVKTGQIATVELDYLPGQQLRGTVDYVYPELDAKTRTLKVRLRFDNAAKSLRPNMFARVEIQGEGTGDVVHIPKEALIRGGSSNRVVVDLGGGRFRSKRVTVGVESGDRVAIRSGLEAGERVVISAQFLIDSESNIDTALRRMEASQ
jgi:Cu(I)/Ag(I) efflux system membrane fusion protein